MIRRLRRLSIYFALIVMGVVGDLASAQSTNSNALYLPLIQKSTTLRVDYAEISYGRYCAVWGHGKITNESNSTVTDVNMTARYYQNDESIGVFTATTGLPATFPFDSNYFRVDAPPECGCTSDPCEVSINADSWSIQHVPEYLPLTVVSQIHGGYIDYCEIHGEIRNDNPVSVIGIEAIMVPANGYISELNLEKTTLSWGEKTSYNGTYVYDGLCGLRPVLAQGAVHE